MTAEVGGASAAEMRAAWFNTGSWPDAEPDRAVAEIRDHADLPAVLEALR